MLKSIFNRDFTEYCRVKNFGKKAAVNDWQKTMVNVDLHRQLPIID